MRSFGRQRAVEEQSETICSRSVRERIDAFFARTREKQLLKKCRKNLQNFKKHIATAELFRTNTIQGRR